MTQYRIGNGDLASSQQAADSFYTGPLAGDFLTTQISPPAFGSQVVTVAAIVASLNGDGDLVIEPVDTSVVLPASLIAAAKVEASAFIDVSEPGPPPPAPAPSSSSSSAAPARSVGKRGAKGSTATKRKASPKK